MCSEFAKIWPASYGQRPWPAQPSNQLSPACLWEVAQLLHSTPAIAQKDPSVFKNRRSQRLFTKVHVLYVLGAFCIETGGSKNLSDQISSICSLQALFPFFLDTTTWLCFTKKYNQTFEAAPAMACPGLLDLVVIAKILHPGTFTTLKG